MGNSVQPETLAERMARLGGDPTKPGTPTVTAGPITPVGIPESEIVRMRSGQLGLKPAIAASLALTRVPDAQAARVFDQVNRRLAPSASSTALNIALSNMVPVGRAADVATDAAIQRRSLAPDADLSRESTVYGTEAALGSVLGNLAGGEAVKAGQVGLDAAEAAPGVKAAIARIGKSALTGAAVNAPLGAVEGAVSAPAGHRLRGAAEGAGQAALVGGLVSGGVGALGEGLAARMARVKAAPAPDVTPVPPDRSTMTPAELKAANLAALVPPTADQAPIPADEGPAVTSLMGALPKQAGFGELAGASAGGVEYRHAGPSLTPPQIAALRTAYRSAMVTPYASAEGEAPALVDALHMAGAAKNRARDLATVRLSRVLGGLSEDQQRAFGQKLVLDNLDAEAERKGVQATEATDPTDAANLLAASERFQQHADALRPQVPDGVESEPWFQQTLTRYRQQIDRPLRGAATQAGVNPSSFREPASAYVKLTSTARLDDAEIRRALDIAGVKDPSELQRRPALLRKLIGENPALRDYFAGQADAPRQGPIAADVGPQGGVPRGQRSMRAGSANQAQGTAQEYNTDLRRIVSADAPDKLVKAARNQVLAQVAKVGRPLEEGEAATPGNRVLAFDDSKGLVTGDAGTHRYEVSPAVHDAVTRFYRGFDHPSTAFQGLKRLSDAATRFQISGMPVEATSHANTLASIVASVPGEKDLAGKVAAAVPGLGAKAAAIREMAGIDFTDPQTIALRDNLADIGALHSTADHGGLANTAHQWLFGPEGVDVRGRLVLARKYLARNPQATDGQLREFITSKLGNYIPENAGALPNFMAKGSALSPFARFQAARIPTAIKAAVGQSDLPASSLRQRMTDIASTLYRGPVGHIVGANLANLALTGKPTFDNEPGHELDVATNVYAVPGGIKRLTPEEAQAQYGDQAKPLFVPAATLNPVAYAGMRATGERAVGRAAAGTLSSEPGSLAKDVARSNVGSDAARDAINVALGTVGPFGRALMTATTGTQPYLQNDNTFLRLTPHRVSGTMEVLDQLKAAALQGNPAVHAFAEPAGDAGTTLGSAVAQDGKPFGGVASILAKVAEFTMPRLVSPAVGGRTNQQSVEAQLDRRLTEATQDYVRRLRNAQGPEERDRILAEARADIGRVPGLDPEAFVAALERQASQEQEATRERGQRQRERRLEKLRQ